MGAAKKADWREERRKRAWNLKEQGWKQKEIAVALGVTEGAVSQWIKRSRDKGEEALKASPAPGVQPRLSAEQKAQLPALLAKGAPAYGFRGEVWTASRVAKVIEQCFGVHYSRDHAGAIMRKMGWSPQKPEEKASQRDEEAIAAWKSERWEALKKSLGGETDDCLGG
ncbi:MAG TPA: IS630 family transposase [Ktedonobacteraceae bacterium]